MLSLIKKLHLKFFIFGSVFFVGSFVIHTFVMFLDYFLMTKPLYLNLQNNFFGSIFSMPMIPMIVVYGIFSLTVFVLINKSKNALIIAKKKELEKEKAEDVLKSMQRLTGILAQHIAAENVEIINWIKSKQLKGETVSKKVTKPCYKIAHTLNSLTEVAFIVPYTEDFISKTEDIDEILNHKLNHKGNNNLQTH